MKINFAIIKYFIMTSSYRELHSEIQTSAENKPRVSFSRSSSFNRLRTQQRSILCGFTYYSVRAQNRIFIRIFHITIIVRRISVQHDVFRYILYLKRRGDQSYCGLQRERETHRIRSMRVQGNAE